MLTRPAESSSQGRNGDAGRIVTFACGAGVQSTAIALLMRDGLIAPPDAAIFADTGWEPAAVYENVAWLQQLFAEMGVPFLVVGRHGAGTDIRGDVLDRRTYATLPAFTVVERVIRAPLSWKRCDCGWATLFGWGGETGVAAIAQFAAGTTVDQIAAHSALDDGDCDCGRCAGGKCDPERAATVLRFAGLDAVPAEHAPCRSAGRIPTAFHTYVKRERGRIKRECTGKYKIEPIQRAVRELLGATVRDVECTFCRSTGRRVAPWDIEAGEGLCSVCRGSGMRRLVGRAPAGAVATHLIGFSTDETERITTAGFPAYMQPAWPLTDLRKSRTQCEDLIRQAGRVPVRSACVGCPNHGNAYWRWLRDNDPVGWADAVAFDREIRTMPGLNGARYLHASCTSLDQAPIDKPTRAQLASAQAVLFTELEHGAPGGCGPHACASSQLSDAIPTVDLGIPGFAAAA